MDVDRPVTFMEIKTVIDGRGRLTVVERLPFDIKRVYWLHDITPGSMRGGHAHKRVRRLCVALNGSFTAVVGGRSFELHQPNIGMLVEPMTWLELHKFSPGAVALFLASEEHDEDDCIRTREEFEAMQ